MNKNYEETRKMIDALVKSAQNGSQGAKETLSITFRPLVISMIQKHVWEKSNWDDAYGEGMVVLLETIDTYNPETKVYFSIYLKISPWINLWEMMFAWGSWFVIPVHQLSKIVLPRKTIPNYTG